MADSSATMTPPPLLDALIIGGGQAGMAAAHRLLSLGYHTILVIEAHGHVGGRTRNFDVGSDTFDTATDNAIELGGTWLSPNHTAVLDLCRELDIDVFRASFIMDDDKEQNKNDAQQADAEWPWWYWGPDYTEKEKQREKDKIFHNSANINQQQQTFRFQSPRELKAKMDPKTLEDLERVGNTINAATRSVENLHWKTSVPGKDWSNTDTHTTGGKLFGSLSTNDGRNILRSVIHNKNAQEPESVSWLYNLISFGGENSSGPDSEYRVRGGTQAIPLAIAKQLGQDRLTLGDAVQSIHADSTFIAECKTSCIKVVTRSGKTLFSKTVIVTGSPPAIQGIDFDPPLPALHAQLLDRMPMGTSRKVVAVYKNGPWWRKYGLTGDILAASLPKELSIEVEWKKQSGEKTVERIPIFGQCFDTSPFSQQFGVLTCFVEGRGNLYFSGLSQEKQNQLEKRFLRHTFENLPGLDDPRNKPLWEPDSIVTYNWADDRYIRGAYTVYFPPGVLSVPEWWRAYHEMEKLPNVFVAGSDYHCGFGNGYIEGAVRSGQAAADLVDEKLKGVTTDSK